MPCREQESKSFLYSGLPGGADSLWITPFPPRRRRFGAVSARFKVRRTRREVRRASDQDFCRCAEVCRTARRSAPPAPPYRGGAVHGEPESRVSTASKRAGDRSSGELAARVQPPDLPSVVHSRLWTSGGRRSLSPDLPLDVLAACRTRLSSFALSASPLDRRPRTPKELPIWKTYAGSTPHPPDIGRETLDSCTYSKGPTLQNA